jgi:DNA topoisomerase-1
MPGKMRKKELRAVGLHWVEADAPGIARKRSGKGFAFYDPSGRLIQDKSDIARFKSLAVPPAWTEVWICADPLGYVQATGFDERGRKQYIYHPVWQDHREERKHNRIKSLDRAVDRIRDSVAKHLRSRGMKKRKVVAAAVSLIDQTWMRIGSERYASENGSFGVTTVRNRHVSIERDRMTFSFTGKSGKKHVIEFSDRSIARILGESKRLARGILLQYIDDFGRTVPVKASDVNEYIRRYGDAKMTAKDFRTWHATRFAESLVKEHQPKTKKEINEIVAMVAERLGNTPAICRKSYIDSGVLETNFDASERVR